MAFDSTKVSNAEVEHTDVQHLHLIKVQANRYASNKALIGSPFISLWICFLVFSLRFFSVFDFLIALLFFGEHDSSPMNAH